MVLLADLSFGVAQIAAIYECCETTVRQWPGRFEAGGAAALRILARSGRPRPFCAAARKQIRHTLELAPAAAGYGFGISRL